MTSTVVEHRRRLPAAYWRQWLASAVSNLGDGVYAAALPLLAVTLTRDERLIGDVTAVGFLPWLVLSLPVGVIVDRYDRKKLMVITNSVRAGLMTVLAIAAGTGSLTIAWLYVILLALGVCEVLFDNAAQAFLPAIVDEDALPRANGRLYAAEVVANNFLGHPFGAVLFAAAVALPFGVDAASFALAALFVATITVRRDARPPTGRGTAGFQAEIMASLRWLRDHALLRTLAVMLALVNLASTFGVAIFVLFATETLDVDTRWYGALLALMAVGAVAGGLFGDRLVTALGRSAALRLTYFVFGVAMIGIGLSPNYWSAAAFGFIDAWAATMWNIVTVSLRQTIIPPQMFGRVNSVYRWLGTGATAIGAFIGGLLAHAFNLRAPFVIGGIVILITLAVCAKGLSASKVAAAIGDR